MHTISGSPVFSPYVKKEGISKEEKNVKETLICLAIALIVGLLMSRLAKILHLPAVTAYLVGGLLFFAVCYPLSMMAGRWERRLKERDRQAVTAIEAQEGGDAA